MLLHKLKTHGVLIRILLGVGLIMNIEAAQIDIQLSTDEQAKVDKREIVIRRLETDVTSGLTQEAIGVIEAPPEKVLEAVTGFSQYHEFMPNVKRIETLSQTDSTAVMNYFLELPMGIKQRYRLKMSWLSRGPQNYIVSWGSIEWPGRVPSETIRATHGFWNIQFHESEKSLVVYHAFVDPGPVPFGFGWIVDFMMESSFPDVFMKTRARVEAF